MFVCGRGAWEVPNAFTGGTAVMDAFDHHKSFEFTKE